MNTPRLFVSYARQDAAFARRLATELRNTGVSIWMDQLDIRAGSRWDNEIEKALSETESLLVILSPQAVASHNVSDEIAFAFDEDKKIIPVLFQSCAIPLRLRRLQYADFSVDFAVGFNELIKTLGLVIRPPAKLPSNKKPDRPIVLPVSEKQPASKEIEKKKLLEFNDVSVSFDRINYDAGFGKLWVNSHSIEYKSSAHYLKIKDIQKIEYLSANKQYIENYIKITYCKGDKTSIAYFMRFTLLGGFIDAPTFGMYNDINSLVKSKKLLLHKQNT